MSKPLWAHQEKALRDAAREFSKGSTAGTIVIPTGGGKTVLGGAAAARHLAKRPEGKVLWVAHREELVSQAYDTLTTVHGLACGVIQSSPTREVNPYRQVQIASTQTLLARGELPPDVTFCIPDEFHHYASDKWSGLLLPYRQRRIPIIGLTATPIRGDGRGFDDLMDFLVCPVTVKELIAAGKLTPFSIKSPPHRLRSNEVAQHPLKAYKKYADGRKAIVFAINVKTANEYADDFNKAGIKAACVSDKTPAAQRRQILDDYKAGRITVLTNVAVLTEGFDDPETSCVILARSVGTLSLYLQICGRAIRACEGKTDAVIIDLHGTCRDPEFGSPDDDREWTLDGDGRKHKEVVKITERFCAICKVLLDADSGNICEFCGIVRPEAEPPKVLDIELVKYEAKRREPEHVRKAYWEKLRIEARVKGYRIGWAFNKYNVLYGEKPRREWLS